MVKDRNARYAGIQNDQYYGMTEIGKIIRNAWAFGLIPEGETCEGWLISGIEDLWRKVNDRWEEYGFTTQGMPPDVRERYLRIQRDATRKAIALGWTPDMEDD
ncbi:MAG: hypothetical protein KDH88_03880 [Chromatiales bacterium]|nr:hypothetical protein [Chromatiales bacterium]